MPNISMELQRCLPLDDAPPPQVVRLRHRPD